MKTSKILIIISVFLISIFVNGQDNFVLLNCFELSSSQEFQISHKNCVNNNRFNLKSYIKVKPSINAVKVYPLSSLKTKIDSTFFLKKRSIKFTGIDFVKINGKSVRIIKIRVKLIKSERRRVEEAAINMKGKKIFLKEGDILDFHIKKGFFNRGIGDTGCFKIDGDCSANIPKPFNNIKYNFCAVKIIK